MTDTSRIKKCLSLWTQYKLVHVATYTQALL